MVINSFRLNLTLPGQRMAIARDILVQLKSKLFVPDEGNTVDLSKPWFTKRDKDPRRLFNMLTSTRSLLTCDVDVLGAIFLSIVKLSEMDVEATEDSDPDGFFIQDIEELVNEIFDWDQIRLIEIAFEGGIGLFIPKDDDEKVAAALYLGVSSKTVLKTIAQNILDNKGMFKLPDDPDEIEELLESYYDEIEPNIEGEDYDDIGGDCEDFCLCDKCATLEDEGEDVCDNCGDVICSCEECDDCGNSVCSCDICDDCGHAVCSCNQCNDCGEQSVFCSCEEDEEDEDDCPDCGNVVCSCVFCNGCAELDYNCDCEEEEEEDE
jgi:hypothetical protein